MSALIKKWLYSHKFVAIISVIGISIVAIVCIAFAFARDSSSAKETTTNPSQVNGQSVAIGSRDEKTSNTSNPSNDSNSEPNAQGNNPHPGTASSTSSGSQSGSSTSSGGSGTSTTPQPLTDWQAIASNADQCSPSSVGNKIYCAPNKIGTFYISTTKNATIKSYYEVNGLDSGTKSGVAVSYQLVSPSTLEVRVSSNRAYDVFGVSVNITVNELATPQSQSAGQNFNYKSYCLTTPPHSGCAP